jgi:hypothetical protein
MPKLKYLRLALNLLEKIPSSNFPKKNQAAKNSKKDNS